MGATKNFDVFYQEEAIIDADIKGFYIQSGKDIIDLYVDETIKPELDDYTEQTLKPKLDELVTEAANSAAEAAASAQEAADMLSTKEDVTNKKSSPSESANPDVDYYNVAGTNTAIGAAIDALQNGAYEGKSYWYGKVTADFVPPAPVDIPITELDETVDRSKINYFDFTTNTLYIPTEDLTGWVDTGVVTVEDKEIVRITKKFWDTNEAGYPGTAEYSVTTGWSYAPRKEGMPDGETITIRDPDGAMQVAPILVQKINFVDTAKPVSEAISDSQKKSITVLPMAGGSVPLATNADYAMMVYSTTIFNLPVLSNDEKSFINTITMDLKIASISAGIGWGTGYFYRGDAPEVGVGTYAVIWDYSLELDGWVCGVVSKGG